MNIDKAELIEIIQTAVDATIKRLEERGLFGNANCGSASAKSEPSAYKRTEQLLYNYMNFKKLVRERQQEIVEIRKYGVPRRGGAVVEYGGNTGTVQGLVLEEERVEAAVRQIEKSMEDTVRAIDLIDKNMATLRYDPYYKTLEMRYFEGRTQEDIAVEFGCTQQNISYNKNRLVKELSLKLFPDKVINEYLGTAN